MTEEENTLFIFLVLKIVALFFTKEFFLNFYVPMTYVINYHYHFFSKIYFLTIKSGGRKF